MPPEPDLRIGWFLLVAGVVVGVGLIAWAFSGSPPTRIAIRPTQTSGAVAIPATPIATDAPAATTTSALAAEPEATPAPSPTAEPLATPEPLPTAEPPATAEPTATPEATPQPIATPSLNPLSVAKPYPEQVVHVREIMVRGKAPPGATITRDIPLWFDDHVVAGPDGRWALKVDLGDGQNTLRFRIGDDRSTEIALTVVYRAPE